MTDHITAPWSPEQVDALNRFQQTGGMHPFTCGRDHDTHRTLVATPAGWTCPGPGCGYTQNWAHAFMAAGERPEPVCKFEQGCHRVVPCDPGCGAARPAAEQPHPTDCRCACDGCRHHNASTVPSPRDEYKAALRKALVDYSEGDYDPGTGSDYGDQVSVVLAVRDLELEQAHASRERWRQDVRELAGQIKAAGQRVEEAEAALTRVRAVIEELDNTPAHGGEADGHWGAAERIRAALNSPESTNG
ncbi:hypothetical protein [Streptomyces sp. NPDC046161]|uniref:hypothetical protein n=1 Tax=Streptomyces sp. NPDC046161 TaxID=3155132 RepID=UPI00340097C8